MIIRRRHTANFTTIGNDLFDDDRLAADELGVLAYLLSRPHNWEVRRAALMRRFQLGPVTMKRVVNNWMRTGWCQAKKVRDSAGRFSILYDICDQRGNDMTDAEIREALSLVSSEASSDLAVHETPEKVPNFEGPPPPSQPLLDGQRVADEGWPIRDITNTDLPKEESNQKPERERARAKEKHAINLAEFKRRWPTAASDDQARIDHAWFDLSSDEASAALSGIPAFLAKLKADKRTTVPAGWKYLREKRWTLIDQTKPTGATSGYPRDSNEAKAVLALYELARCGSYARGTMIRDGVLYYYRPVTQRMLALANAPAVANWVAIDRRQAAAWEGLLSEAVTVQTRTKLREGDSAPWPWPPSVDGKLYTDATGPPESLMTEDDYSALK